MIVVSFGSQLTKTDHDHDGPGKQLGSGAAFRVGGSSLAREAAQDWGCVPGWGQQPGPGSSPGLGLRSGLGAAAWPGKQPGTGAALRPGEAARVLGTSLRQV